MATAEAMMHVVHQLLNNPRPLGASLLVVEQWRHDIDQLIITAINTPPLGENHQPPEGHACTPTPPQAPWAPRVSFAVRLLSTARPPSMARAPSATCTSSGPWVPVTSIATGDLRDEFHCHKGENSRVSIERRRERRRNIKARNLEKDFSSHSPVREVPEPWAGHSPSPPAALRGGGVHGTRTIPLYGGLAVQVPTPPDGEI
jgi:hypothetical protein